jgi:peptidoglycan/LPS O-acetylase OafA/YrhL
MQALVGVPGYLGPAWSLAIEEQFYLLLPPFVRKLRRGALIKLLLAAVLLAPVARAVCCFMAEDQSKGIALAGLLLACRWDGLLTGVLIACGMRDERFCRWIAARLGLARAVWAALAAGTIAFAVCDTNLDTVGGRIAGYVCIDYFFACTLLLSRANERGILRNLFSRPVWSPLATISYGLYLIQGPTMALRESVVGRLGYPPVGWKTTGVYALFLALTFVLAALSWRCFEKPILKASHRHKFT